MDNHLKEVLPLLQPYLDQSNLLNCRLVSQAWKTSLDDAQLVFNDHDVEFLREPEFIRGKGSCFVGTFLQRHDGVSRFFEDMQNEEGNPFPNHAVTFSEQPGLYKTRFSVREDGEDEDVLPKKNFCPLMRNLLAKFGGYIWNCTYIASDDFFQVPNHCQTLLSLMPNLKRLDLDLSHVPWDSHFDAHGSFGIATFPELVHLEELSVSGQIMNYLTSPLLIKYGSQLKTFSSCADEYLYSGNVVDKLPENIEKLWISPISLSVLESTIFEGNSWPLRVLHLGIIEQRGTDVLSMIQSCVQLLDKFSGSLETARFAYGLQREYYDDCKPALDSRFASMRICHCNNNDMNCDDYFDYNSIKYLKLRLLELPHAILHPEVFPRLMAKCVNLKRLLLNGYQGGQGAPTTESVVVPGRELKWARYLVQQVLGELPKSVERVSLMTQGHLYNEVEYRFNAELLHKLGHTSGRDLALMKIQLNFLQYQYWTIEKFDRMFDRAQRFLNPYSGV